MSTILIDPLHLGDYATDADLRAFGAYLETHGLEVTYAPGLLTVSDLCDPWDFEADDLNDGDPDGLLLDETDRLLERWSGRNVTD